MKGPSIDDFPGWFNSNRYINISIAPQQWRIQLEARALIRILIKSPNTVHTMQCRNGELLELDQSNGIIFASNLIDHIAANPVLPTDYFIRTHFNEPMIGALRDSTVELTGAAAAADTVGTVKKSPYVAPIHLGDAVALAQLSDDAGYTIPETSFDPPELRRDVNELIREFPKRFITGAASPPGGTKVYASIDLNGPDDVILSQLHSFIRKQRREFNIYPTSKPQYESINKLLEYKILEILDLENWSLLNGTKILSTVYRSLFDNDVSARSYREVQKAFAQSAMTPKFLNFLKGL